MLREFLCVAGDNLLMNPQFLWCTLDGRAASGGEGQEGLVEQLQAYAAIKSYGDMAHQPFGIVLEVGRAHAADCAPIAPVCSACEPIVSGGWRGAGGSAEREQALER